MDLFGRNLILTLALVLVSSGFSNDAAQTSPASRAQNLTPAERERRFLSVPDPKVQEANMLVLASQPHIAGSIEDRKTADFVAEKFREAGLETSISEYKVWLNYPQEIAIDVTYPEWVHMHGPSPERVDGDPYQANEHVLPPFSGYSPSGDVTADVVYANYGRPEDFAQLESMGVDVRGKIILVRYGENFRGVKTYLSQEKGAVGVIIYSDPIDDGYFKGDVYPNGPWRPASSVQRGTVEFGFEHPGDPTTPGFASTMSLPDSQRVDPLTNPDMPRIPTAPLSYRDAQPLLENLSGPETPRDWQGALPFTYHVGPGPVKVHLKIKNDYEYRTIWNVIGKIKGTDVPDELVIAGNHRDAWVYGAADPVSGTIAMLEAVRGLGELMKTGWRPKRTILFASWDAEEQGLVGSTEWVEEHEGELGKTVAYFNTDIGGAGPMFRAAATPSLKEFMRDISRVVSDPRGGTVYDHWREPGHTTLLAGGSDVTLGNLGSGSDYTSFVDHLGVASSDIRSTGNYGVYHSVFDNYDWFRKFGDPGFVYSQMIARIFGLEVLRMADAQILPLDYETYGNEILRYLWTADRHSKDVFGDKSPSFSLIFASARRFATAGAKISALQKNSPDRVTDVQRLNTILIGTERQLLLPNGLPRRPWFRHSIYAPADLKGYTASVIPGVNEAIQNNDVKLTTDQINQLRTALDKATAMLESYWTTSTTTRQPLWPAGN